MKNFIMLAQIFEHVILLQLAHRFDASQMILILILLYTERNKIGNILLKLIHNTLYLKAKIAQLEQYDK